ncbi:hypothetical protein JW926_04355 [Candidatus Sumerlaeota bacterium]|nr:hypothetical protein [Candidatus Sumerlaeota bacterium]
MKAVIIAYNEAIDEEVMEVLDKNEVKAYTKWTKTLGKGTASGPHLMTNIWPIANNVIFCVVEENQASGALKDIRSLREEFPQEGIKAFQIPVEEVT